MSLNKIINETIANRINDSNSAASCRIGLVVCVSDSRTEGRGFASRPGHTKDHHKNSTNCLPTWQAMR